jgi:acetylornithine deacetylase/succinyl-diaminopimelate desuccinylase-like protein
MIRIMTSLLEYKNWLKSHLSEIKKDYFEFLRFRSISADPAYKKETEDCAKWLKNYIAEKTNLKAELIPTVGYPLVYAESPHSPKAQTLLVYGHYDVQPVDPLELWESDPFTPTERNGKVYARGAVDDKGQIFYAVIAARCWHELGRQLPINLKFCIEGEEESSSRGLAKALPSLKEKLRADSLLVVDFDQFDEKTPALSMGARGLVALEATIIGSNGDLHSGLYGGVAYNPNRALSELIAKFWDENGRVAVDGFYDDVAEMNEADLKQFAFSLDEARVAKEFGIRAYGKEKGRFLGEAVSARPTLEINGMSGGYTGAGMKTVIPAKANVKITCRLVPNQDPKKIGRQVAEFIEKNIPSGMKVEITQHGGERAFRASPTSSIAKAVSIASKEVMGKPCVSTLSGGSIPVVAVLLDTLKAEMVGMGYGLPTDQIHAPNEHFSMDRFEKGFLTLARTFELL